MEVKKIVEGMTATEVAKVIDDNFTGLNKEKANKEETAAQLSKLGTELGIFPADLSKVSDSGFKAVIDGVTESNSAWVHGVIPLTAGDVIIFNSLPSAQYSGSTTNYFVDSDGKGIQSGSFKGDVVLGAGVVEVEAPKGAKGLMFNAHAKSLSAYDISIKRVGIQSDIESIKAELNITAKGNTKIYCPSHIYAVVGEELNLYYDSLIKGVDDGINSPLGIHIDVECPTLQNASNQIGVRRERMWQIEKGKLTDSYIGNHAIYITAYDINGNVLDKTEVTLVVANSIGLTKVKNVLCIGDSLTMNGPIVFTCYQKFSDLGGEIPNFIGQKTTYGVKHEGYPGYTFNSFVTSGSENAFFIFDIPSGTSVTIGDKYSTNSSTYTVTDIRTEGQDNALRLRCTRSGSTLPNEEGTLTKVSGASSSPSSISYTAFEAETGNPFWDKETSSVNFTKYREKMGMGGEKFDVVVIMLGTNDCIGDVKSSMKGSVNNAKVLINAILADAGDYNTKVILQMTPADANTISSWQVYADSAVDGRKMGYWNNLWNLRKIMCEEFTKEEWTGKVFLGQAALGVDRYYGYPYTEVQSSSRIDVKEIYHTNSVHPNKEGYQQFGDGYFLQIKGLIS